MSSIFDPSFAAVRDDVVSQHARLRALLDELDAAATRVVRSASCDPCDLPGMLDGLVHELEAHMAFEEHALSAAPVMADAWGPRDLAHLSEEHERQREELARITRGAHASDDRISLALAIRAFVSDVLLDMSLEEARFQRTEWSVHL